MTYSAFTNPVNKVSIKAMTSNNPPITIEIFDKPIAEKKWIGGNRDSSNVVMRRRQNAIIINSTTPGPQTVNTTDNNVRRHALSRLRGSGNTVPPKVTGRIMNFNSPIPPTPPTPAVNPIYFRIISAGGNAVVNYLVNPVSSSAKGEYPGFYNYIGQSMTPLATLQNNSFKLSHNVMTIDRTTGVIIIKNFNVNGYDGNLGSSEEQQIITYLRGLNSSVIVVIATYDEPAFIWKPGQENPISIDFISEMKRCGASSDFASNPA
jgi:hypothetical protein